MSQRPDGGGGGGGDGGRGRRQQQGVPEPDHPGDPVAAGRRGEGRHHKRLQAVLQVRLRRGVVGAVFFFFFLFPLLLEMRETESVCVWTLECLLQIPRIFSTLLFLSLLLFFYIYSVAVVLKASALFFFKSLLIASSFPD